MGPGAGEAVLGIVLTLAAMLILAGRLVSEEFALEGMHLHPLQVGLPSNITCQAYPPNMVASTLPGTL